MCIIGVASNVATRMVILNLSRLHGFQAQIEDDDPDQKEEHTQAQGNSLFSNWSRPTHPLLIFPPQNMLRPIGVHIPSLSHIPA